MPNYLLTWKIDIEDVDSPEQAVIEAIRIQRDPDGCATWFTVKDKDTGKEIDIDGETLLTDNEETIN